MTGPEVISVVVSVAVVAGFVYFIYTRVQKSRQKSTGTTTVGGGGKPNDGGNVNIP